MHVCWVKLKDKRPFFWDDEKKHERMKKSRCNDYKFEKLFYICTYKRENKRNKIID